MKYFTKLDVRWGYNNIQIKEGDQWKAAFKTNRGLFEPTVMFFGLCNSPATFQSFMDRIFKFEILGNMIIIYMDDILIFAATKEELRHKTRHVLKKLRKNDLYLKPEKCAFKKQIIKYLGLIIKPDHIAMDPIKLAGIAKWPTPIKVKDIQKFLGFANFYKRFINHYTDIAQPLDNLKAGKLSWNWTPKCQKAFDTLKTAFTWKPILLMPDKTKLFFLETDASKVASGAVLQHFDGNGNLKLCGFISKAFDPTQQRYQIYDRELLGII